MRSAPMWAHTVRGALAVFFLPLGSPRPLPSHPQRGRGGRACFFDFSLDRKEAKNVTARPVGLALFLTTDGVRKMRLLFFFFFGKNLLGGFYDDTFNGS